MAQILFSVSNWSDIQQERLAGKVRLSMFLIAGVCGGLPTLAWALLVFYRQRKSGVRISAVIVLLLSCDLLVLLLVPYIVRNLLHNEFCWDSRTCQVWSSLWVGAEMFGLHLQQMVGLEGALAWRYPATCNYAFFYSCSTVFSIITLVCFFLCELYSVDHLMLLGLPLLFTVTMTSWIVTCRAPAQVDDASCRAGRSRFTVLVLVTLTMVLYVVFSSMSFVLRNHSGERQDLKSYWDVWVTCLSLMSLRVVFDPLLCVLVYRRSRVQTQQN